MLVPFGSPGGGKAGSGGGGGSDEAPAADGASSSLLLCLGLGLLAVSVQGFIMLEPGNYHAATCGDKCDEALTAVPLTVVDALYHSVVTLSSVRDPRFAPALCIDADPQTRRSATGTSSPRLMSP